MAQSVIETTIMRTPNEVAVAVRFLFLNGETFTIDLSDLAPHLMAEAMAHGLKQKIGDAAAIARNPETGRSATVGDKFAACMAIYNRLTVDQRWNAERGEGSGTGGLLLRALAQFAGQTIAQIKPAYDAYTDEQKAALRRNPKIAAIIATLKPEPKADASIDTDALLANLGG